MAGAAIAIVDGDQPYVEYLQAFLKSRGYNTASHQSAEALLAGLRQGPLPDVILLDVDLPGGLDGLETLRQIRLAHPTAQVVMVSSSWRYSTEKMVEAMRFGACDCVMKPGDAGGELALESAIRNALGRGAPETDRQSATDKGQRVESSWIDDDLSLHESMQLAEKRKVQGALERFRWNRRKTAEFLQISYKSLLVRMKKHGIAKAP